MKQLSTVNDDIQEVHTKFMINDLKRWDEELKIIDVEMSFYDEFLQASCNIVPSSENERKAILEHVDEFQKMNEEFKQEFIEFSNKLEGIVECDDLQCETYYVNNHTEFKQSIEKHFSLYKTFKSRIFAYLRTVAIR